VIQNVADLYTNISSAKLVTLERYAKQSADQLVAAIEESKGRPLSLLIFGLGIPHVGFTAAQLLARRFGNLDALSAAAREEKLSGIQGIGPVIAKSVTAFFNEERNQDLLKRLKQAGVNTVEPTAAKADGTLSGKTYVLTGSLPTLSRSQATSLIEEAGGRVAGSISKKTDALVAGDDAGSKLDKAKSLGVEVIDEVELLKRVSGEAGGR
jgi:DNA ligase (NAD+)